MAQNRKISYITDDATNYVTSAMVIDSLTYNKVERNDEMARFTRHVTQKERFNTVTDFTILNLIQ